jgi:hypothetical protein
MIRPEGSPQTRPPATRQEDDPTAITLEPMGSTGESVERLGQENDGMATFEAAGSDVQGVGTPAGTDGLAAQAQPENGGGQSITVAGQAVDADSTQLLGTQQLDSLMARWQQIQVAFVDEPRRAVQEADALVAELMEQLTRVFALQRDGLESQWSSGQDVSTEDLRVGLQRYRSLFQRLLAA